MMSNMKNNPDELNNLISESPPEQMRYEEAFAELEQIVQALEANEYPLERALQLFERGQALARHCAALLDEAELKVQQIIGDELVDFIP
jgi:exodeoxyribonuclease VII small subunit